MILAISSNHDYYYVYCIIHVATKNLAVTPDQGPGNEADAFSDVMHILASSTHSLSKKNRWSS